MSERIPTITPQLRRASLRVAMLICLLLSVGAVFSPVAVLGIASAAPGHAGRLSAKHKARKKKKPAPATIKMKLLGSVAPESPENASERRGWLYTDGARWAAYEPTASTTRLIDTSKNKTIERPDPEGCADGLIAVGGGEMLYSCEDPECPEHERRCPLPSDNQLASTRYVVEDIASGDEHPVAGEDTLPNQSPEAGVGELSEVGSEWAQGGIGTHVGGYRFFLNWHTGQLVKEEDDGSERNIENLSAPNLTQDLCKPITRLKNEDEYQFADYSPLQYTPPFAVVGPLGTASEVSYVPLQLRKCRSGKRVLLPPGTGIQLGGWGLSWVGSVPYITQLHAKGRVWHGPYYELRGVPKETSGGRGYFYFVRHTSDSVFVTVQPGLAPAQVYLARLPWARSAR